MTRSARLLTNVGIRGFSTTPRSHFLRRLQWPLRRKEQPVPYRLHVVPPGQATFFASSRRFLFRFIIITSLVYYFAPFSIQVSVEDHDASGVRSSPASQEGGQDGDDDYEEVDDEDVDLFIPLSWPVKSQPQYYTGTDPEWELYREFAHSKENQQNAFAMIVSVCRQAFVETPQLAKAMGKIDMKRGKYWFEVGYPMGPPADYEQVGILISNGWQEVSMALQTVSQEEYNKLSRMFDLKSMYRCADITVRTTYEQISQLFSQLYHNFSTKVDHTAHDHQPTSLGKEETNTARTIYLPPPPRRSVAEQVAASEARKAQARAQQGSTQDRPMKRPATSTLQPDNGQQPASDVDEMAKKAHIQSIYRDMFALPFSEKPITVDPPRGTVVLDGLVECIGTKAVAVVDMRVLYDLEEHRIVMHTARIRHIRPHRLRPLGK